MPSLPLLKERPGTGTIPLTFLLSPTTALTWYPPAARTLTAALLGNPRIDARLSRLPVDLLVDSFRHHRGAYRGRDFAGTLDSYMRMPMRAAPHLDVVAGRYDARILAAAETELVLLSALSVFDLFVVKLLLGAGKRVVLGGNLTTLYSSQKIRDLLAEIGTDPGRAARDLVILRGHVTPATDLAAPIDAWRDADLPVGDWSQMLTARQDLLAAHVRTINSVNRRPTIALPLSTGCWFGKCEFCTARLQDDIDFTAGLSAGAVAAYFKELAALYQTSSIILTDNYPRLTDKLRAILAERKPLRVGIYSGIHLLRNADYVKSIAPYVDGIRIGVESGSDFALDQVKKGFHFADVERAVDNIIAHLDRDTNLTLLIVYDLPHRSADDVRAGFGRLADVKLKLDAAGFRRVIVSGFPLLPFPETSLMSHPLIEAAPPSAIPDGEMSGAWTLQRWYEKAHGIRLPDELDRVVTAFRRRDEAGAVLPCDFELLDEATVELLEGYATSDGVVV